MNPKTLPLTLLFIYAIIFTWSSINPSSFTYWMLEVIPVFLGVLLLVFTYSRFPLTPLAYILLWITASLVTIGSHYTYESMPVFNWFRAVFGLQRNHYDRFVHWVGGITVAILVREILLRKTPLRPGKWVVALVLSTCLASGSIFELSEFALSILAGVSYEEALGTQGDIWDTHWDLLVALIGGVFSLLFFSRYHQKQLLELRVRKK